METPTIDLTRWWLVAHLLASYGGGIALGIVIGLSIRKFRGPPVRWVEEHGITKYEGDES